jgi:NADP-dependent aldehyde dehydrogenase
MTDIVSVDPRTGAVVEVVAPETTSAEVDRFCTAALTAADGLDGLGRAGRAALLRALADGLEGRRDDVVAVADRETALGAVRLNGELTRTGYQLRLFADVVEEGSYLEAAIDHAADTAMGPRPDLRRMLVPIGPVAVFGASNFPLAFSVPGGDTASALAAGCPVVVKAHGSIPPPHSWSLTSCTPPSGQPAPRTEPSPSCTACKPAPTWSRTRRSGQSGSPAP